jgi:glutathione S-transferase
VLVNRRLGGKGTVPLLVDAGTPVSDSSSIALYLEERYPAHSLLPGSPEERASALELEDYFDRQLGPAVRRWIYGQALETPGLVPRLFFGGYGLAGQAFGAALGGIVAWRIRQMYRIDGTGVAKSAADIDEAATRIESLLHGDPSRHLVGGSLSLADITAAALMAPLVGPPGTAYDETPDLPSAVIERRGELRARVAGRWVMERYARDRRVVQ